MKNDRKMLIYLCAAVLLTGCGLFRLPDSVIRQKVEEAIRDSDGVNELNPFPYSAEYFETMEITVKELRSDFTGIVHVRITCFGEEHEIDLDYQLSPVGSPSGLWRLYATSDPKRWKLDLLRRRGIRSAAPLSDSYYDPAPLAPKGLDGPSPRQKGVLKDARGLR